MSETPAPAPAPTFRVLPVAGAAEIDGLRLVGADDAPRLLISVQTVKTPRSGWNDHQMNVSAIAPRDPTRVSPVASLPRLLPPPPTWDARPGETGEPEIVFEEAQGALYRLLLRGSDGDVRSPSAAHPLESFHFPRFLRGSAGRSLADVSAVRDKKGLVVFRQVTAPASLPAPADAGSAGATAPSAVIAPAYEAVVGVTEVGIWAVTKSVLSIPGDFGAPPGRLSLVRLKSLDAASVVSSTPFAGFVAGDFDAVGTPGDVVIFAAGKPAALLLASRPAQPIALAAENRAWLSALSRPTMSVGGGVLHLAALAHARTADAKILYAEIPLASLARR